MARERRLELRLEPAVDLDGVDALDAIGEEGRQRAEPGPDLQYDVRRTELRKPFDHPEDVRVDEKVLAESVLGNDGLRHGSENRRLALASIFASRSSGAPPRAAASAPTVWTTCAGSFVRPRTGCGAR